MFLNLNVFGETFLQNTAPAKQGYDQIRIYGNSVVDECHVRNVELTDAEIIALNSEETFGTNTILLAHFNGTLQAGNYESLDLPIDKYRIVRRKTGESQYKILTEIPQASGVTSYKDYSGRNLIEYEYGIFPVSSNGTVGSSSVSLSTHDFYGWFLSDLNNTICYKFDLQIESESLQSVVDLKIYDTYTQFPLVSQGKRNYVSGGLTTIPYSLNGNEIEINVSILETLKSFINNREQKILRNTAGEIFQVATTGFSYKYMDNIQSQPHQISFQFVQTGTGE